MLVLAVECKSYCAGKKKKFMKTHGSLCSQLSGKVNFMFQPQEYWFLGHSPTSGQSLESTAVTWSDGRRELSETKLHLIPPPEQPIFSF